MPASLMGTDVVNCVAAGKRGSGEAGKREPGAQSLPWTRLPPPALPRLN
jgi:hypothetical protein